MIRGFAASSGTEWIQSVQSEMGHTRRGQIRVAGFLTVCAILGHVEEVGFSVRHRGCI